MSDKSKYNPQIHHRSSIRLKGYDYSQTGLYFITICTKDRKCLFGKIQNDEMILNNAGKIADQCWLHIPNHFPNAVLHKHTVMPNHVHGIIELSGAANAGIENFQPLPINTGNAVGAENFLPLQQPRNEFQKIIPRSIGSIVKGFKIGVTKWFHSNTEIEIVWQRNYHEHIIRNEQSYQNISEYIINNPTNWKEDKFYG